MIKNYFLAALRHLLKNKVFNFAGAGMVAMAVAILAITWRSYLAATRNPVEVLKYD